MRDMRPMKAKTITRADRRMLIVVEAAMAGALALGLAQLCFLPQGYGDYLDDVAAKAASSASVASKGAEAGFVHSAGRAPDERRASGADQVRVASNVSSTAEAQRSAAEQPAQSILDVTSAAISQFSKESKRTNAIQPDAKLPGGSELEAAAKAAEKAKRDMSAKATSKSFRKVPSSRKLSAFVAYGSHRKPKLKRAQTKAIEKAIRAIERAGADCGAVFVDLHSGCGIAYNAGKPVYSASAFKAPFVLYMLKSAGKKGIGEGDRDSVESAILYSSNGAYDSLTFPRMGQDYIKWLEGYGIEYRADTPFYMFTSAKSMVRIWADLYQYLKSGSKDAKWFAKLLADTNRSYIRDGVAGKNITVRNKAGWISGDYDAATDCAYIDVKGRPYLMAIMTSQPASQTSFERVSALARQLFAARSVLK